MKIYIAARFSRRDYVRILHAQLTKLNYICTSNWCFNSPKDQSTSSLKRNEALRDISDIRNSHLIVLLTDTSDVGYITGGKHVELGLALALNKLTCVVGERENVFHYLDAVNHFDTWDGFLDFIQNLPKYS